MKQNRTRVKTKVAKAEERKRGKRLRKGEKMEGDQGKVKKNIYKQERWHQRQ
jgi:hypothetical protein